MAAVFMRVGKRGRMLAGIVLGICCLAAVGYFLFRQNAAEKAPVEGESDQAGYAVRHIVWDMGTEEERICDIFYDPDSGKFSRVNEMGTVPIDYSGSTKAAMEFSFTEGNISYRGLTEDALAPDFGVTDICRGTLKEAGRFYAGLIAEGYENRYTIVTANAVDIYLLRYVEDISQQGNEQAAGEDDALKMYRSYRLMIVPEAGGNRCTVTFAEVENTVLAAAGEQLEKYKR